MTAQHRAPSNHRISTRAWAITALVLVLLLVGFLAVAKASSSDSAEEPSVYDSGYAAGHAFAVAKGYHDLDDVTAWRMCWKAAQNNPEIAEFQWQAMATGCTAGIVAVKS